MLKKEMGGEPMQRRPSVVYVRRRCIKRRSIRCWMVFLCCLL